MAGKSKVRDGHKRCSAPDHHGDRWLSLDEFQSDRSQPSGKKSRCRDCHNDSQLARDRKPTNVASHDARRRERVARADERDDEVIAETAKVARARIKYEEQAAEKAAARDRRLASDVAALKPDDLLEDDDYDTTVANDKRQGASKLSKEASRGRRQEFNEKMGDHLGAVRRAAVAEKKTGRDMLELMPEASGEYVAALAEQERRFGNRRLARSISLFAANEEQARRLFMATARQYFSDKIVPVGYAKKPGGKPIKRSVCLMLSDLHIGSDLSGVDNPSQFGAVEEARRLEYVLRQVIDYKPQYRDNSELVLMWNGDLIEGLLLHDLRDGAPLAEQKAAFWSYASAFIGECAAAFPRVRNFFKPGNHGRDKVRHQGRATSRKWDSHEFELGFALMMMTSSLKNVTWEVDAQGNLDRKPYSIIDLHGSNFLLTHSDTEIKLGDPDTKARENFAELSNLNSTLKYGARCAAFGFGHYHKARYQIGGGVRILWNGALLPPNGHARTMGYAESCGQWLFEAVEGYPVGDVRLIEVGRAQDRDERLGSIIKPFRFALE